MNTRRIFCLIFPLRDERFNLRKKAGFLERQGYFFNALKSSLKIPFQERTALKNDRGNQSKKHNLKKVQNDKIFQKNNKTNAIHQEC